MRVSPVGLSEGVFGSRASNSTFMQTPNASSVAPEANLDALLIALYSVLDETLPRQRQRGPAPAVTDAELVCMAVAQVLLGYAGERHWLRNACRHVGHLFPRILDQSGYTRRLRRLGPELLEAVRLLAFLSGADRDPVKIADSTPVPVAASRETVKRSAFAGHAAYGRCTSHHRHFYGFRLHLVCAPCGIPIGFELAAANVDDRIALREIAPWCLAPGDLLLADKNYRSSQLEQELLELYGTHLARPDRINEPRRFGSLGRYRQWIESVFDTLKSQLSLEQHGARTMSGLIARIGQRLLALAAAIWHNLDTGHTSRSLIAYDH